ncbi:DUF123 domain-containing protein [Chloroflexota bacterium]
MAPMLSKNDLDNRSKGSYVLLIRIPEEQTITIGGLDTIRFPAGDYAYVGSALNGLKSRLNRHLRKDKKLHWHIDYLRQRATICNIIICETEDRVECTIAQALSRQFDFISGFGASDCKCPSHLFFTAEEMEQEIMATLKPLRGKLKLIKIPTQEMLSI